MANKPKGSGEQPTTPTDFAITSPAPTGTDLSTWLLNAVTKNGETLSKLDASVSLLRTQIDRIEGKLDTVKDEVKGHGHWIHTLKFVLGAIGMLVSWVIVFAIWPWVKSKVLPGP